MKKLIGLIVVLLLIFTCSLTAFAEESSVPFIGGGEIVPGGAANDNPVPFIGGGAYVGDENNESTVNPTGVGDEQFEKAYNELLELVKTDEEILDVQIMPGAKIILVEVVDYEGHEKEYAKRFIDQYGAFVTATDDIESLLKSDLEVKGGGGLTNGGEAGGAIPDIGGNANPFNPFLIMVPCGIFLFGIASFFFLKKRRMATLQTANGNVVVSDSTGSRKATIAAVKDSETAPNKEMFDSIIQRIDNNAK